MTDITNINTLNLIKKFEGFRSRMYKDSAGLPTIGYGTLIDEPSELKYMTEPISVQEAEELLMIDLKRLIKPCLQKIKVELNQNQFDAIASFIYNLGSGNFLSSTLLKKINKSDFKGAAEEFPKWCRAGGREVQGLINRRNEERILFLTPIQNYIV